MGRNCREGMVEGVFMEADGNDGGYGSHKNYGKVLFSLHIGNILYLCSFNTETTQTIETTES